MASQETRDGGDRSAEKYAYQLLAQDLTAVVGQLKLIRRKRAELRQLQKEIMRIELSLGEQITCEIRERFRILAGLRDGLFKTTRRESHQNGEGKNPVNRDAFRAEESVADHRKQPTRSGMCVEFPSSGS